MDWTAVITSVSIGSVISTLIGLVIQDRAYRQQHSQWLRDKRLEAFTDVAKEFVSFGLHDKGLRSPFEAYGAVARALLLIDDESLNNRIDQFIVKLNEMNTLCDTDKHAEANVLYQALIKDAREIVADLRAIVLHKEWRNEVAP